MRLQVKSGEKQLSLVDAHAIVDKIYCWVAAHRAIKHAIIAMISGENMPRVLMTVIR